MIKVITLRTLPQAMPWKECIREAASTGYDAVELNFDGRFQLDCSQDILNEIKTVTRECAIKVDSVYSRQQWRTPISSANPEVSRTGTKAISRLIEIASFLEARIVLVIPGAVDNSILSGDVEITAYDEVYRRSGEAIKGLSTNAEREEVILAVENVPGKFLLTPLEMKRFVEEIGSPAVGCYFDVANCLYAGGFPGHWIGMLGGLIKAIHVKDYRLPPGNLSNFVSVFEGDINWKEVAKALAEIGYDYSLTSEVLPPFKHHPECLWRSVSAALDLLRGDIEEYKKSV